MIPIELVYKYFDLLDGKRAWKNRSPYPQMEALNLAEANLRRALAEALAAQRKLVEC